MSASLTKMRLPSSSVNGSSPANVTNITLLSVVVILLSFFVLLDSKAVFDSEKSKRVFGSLAPLLRDPDAPFTAAPGSHNTQSFATYVATEQEKWRSQYSLQTTIAPDRIVLQLATVDLFLPEDEQVRAKYIALFEDFAGKLRYLPVTVQIEVPAQESLLSAPNELELAAKRAMALFRLLYDLGVPAKKLTASGTIYRVQDSANAPLGNVMITFRKMTTGE